MSFRRFEGYVPPARSDEPWLGLRLYEGPTSAGSWTLIDTITFTTPDADSENPGVRDFETLNATLDEGWYYAEFFDSGAGVADSDVRRYPYNPLDIRLMVPRVRRALVPLELHDELVDDAVKDAVADACAAIVLKTGTLFGKTLEVAERGQYGAPTEYAVSEELTLPEQTVVACQAALDYFGREWSTRKTSEKIGDEASTWEWGISAQMLVAQLRKLQADRDQAIEDSASAGNLDQFRSFIYEHDRWLSLEVEPWVGIDGWQGGSAGMGGLDTRFGTFG